VSDYTLVRANTDIANMAQLEEADLRDLAEKNSLPVFDYGIYVVTLYQGVWFCAQKRSK